VRQGTLGLVALGPAGLWVVDVTDPSSPVVTARIAEGKDVIGVFVSAERTLHVVAASYAIESFNLSNPRAPRPIAFAAGADGLPAPVGAGTGLPAGPAPSPAREPEGTVVQVAWGRAIVDRGAKDGLRIGNRLKILSQELVPKPNLATGQSEMVPSNEAVAVLEIEVLDDHRASAPLHRGDRVRMGDRFVRTTEPPTERLFMAPRQDYTHRLAATFRPIIELGTLGLGSLSDLRYTYRFPFPLALEVGTTPLAFEVRRGDGPRQFPIGFDATAFYDTDFFAVGLGAGGMVFPRREEVRYEPFPATAPTVSLDKGGTHFALTQAARLGNLDGLSVEVRNTFVYRRAPFDERAAFHWGSTMAHGFVPLSRRLTLGLGGGGGDNGWGFGEIGVRTYFKGTGGAGTIIVPASLGFGGFTSGESDRVGPLVTIGVELRL
jgi:hypothetical protein